MLGLTAQYHGPSTITAWSSGTGFAGILGRNGGKLGGNSIFFLTCTLWILLLQGRLH